jgi:hypothetical protein
LLTIDCKPNRLEFRVYAVCVGARARLKAELQASTDWTC